MHGEPAELSWRRRRVRLRPLILILDVSGSMADYSRGAAPVRLLAKRAAARVEVFCFGTRLTRITRGARSPAARRRAGASGARGLRLGGRHPDRRVARRVRPRLGPAGLCRGGIVVICSDGLDRGDPDVLATAMERLSRLCHRVVWMNPHKGDSAALPAEHARHDGRRTAHRPAAVRARSEQPGRARGAAAGWIRAAAAAARRQRRSSR